MFWKISDSLCFFMGLTKMSMGYLTIKSWVFWDSSGTLPSGDVKLAMGIEMAIESSLMNRHEKWVKFPVRCVQVYQRVTLRSSTNEMDVMISVLILL